jgi:hypothetical protein
VDPFEAFFNGGSGYVEVKRNIVARASPYRWTRCRGNRRLLGRCGAVQHLWADQQDHRQGRRPRHPACRRLGHSNLKLIKQPEVNFPKDFDKYDPKITDKTKLTTSGVGGNMVYDFLVVPRNQGQFTIPEVSLTYYDTQANTYKTVKTKPFALTVTPGDGKNTSATYDAPKDNDIRTIKEGQSSLGAASNGFFGSTTYWVSLLIPLLAFIVLLIVFRKRAIDNADVVKMRGKHASKMARKRLKKASQLMFKGRSDEFFDEVLRALWGYVSYKLNIPVEQLSRENISEKLTAHRVDDNTVRLFLSALDECEFERYAPGDVSGNMEKTFQSAMTAIMEIEHVMKKSKQ